MQTFVIWHEKYVQHGLLLPCCDHDSLLYYYIIYIYIGVFNKLYLFVGGLMSYVCYLCSIAWSGVKHVLTINTSNMVGFLIRSRKCFPFASSWDHPRLVLVWSVLPIVLVFWVFFFVLIFVCPMLPMSLECSLKFIYMLYYCDHDNSLHYYIVFIFWRFEQITTKLSICHVNVTLMI